MLCPWIITLGLIGLTFSFSILRNDPSVNYLVNIINWPELKIPVYLFPCLLITLLFSFWFFFIFLDSNLPFKLIKTIRCQSINAIAYLLVFSVVCQLIVRLVDTVFVTTNFPWFKSRLRLTKWMMRSKKKDFVKGSLGNPEKHRLKNRKRKTPPLNA